jgi:hypothetical protein
MHIPHRCAHTYILRTTATEEPNPSLRFPWPTDEALPEKVLAAFRLAMAHSPRVLHAIKADIDLEIGSPERNIAVGKGSLDLPEELQMDYLGCFIHGTTTTNWHYGRVTEGSYWDNRKANMAHSNTVYAGGAAGYMLSRDAMAVLLELDAEEAATEYIYEDLMTGRQLGTEVRHWECCCE